MNKFFSLKFSALLILLVLVGGTISNSQSLHLAFAASNAVPAPGVPVPSSVKIPILTKQGVHASSYSAGDVFAAIGSGKVNRFSPTGTLLQTLDTTTGSSFTTGMCFDKPAGNLYVTTFGSNIVSKFDNAGNLLMASWASGLNASPESCVVDASNHVYVGDADGLGLIYKFDTAGTQLDTYTLAKENRGTDWLDLASDQCTMHYTSEGGTIKAFNVCTKTQLPDFATGLSGPCFAHRITSDGGELVACSNQAYKLDNTGAITKTYPNPGGTNLFALNLDPDGTTFWTGDFGNGNIYHLDIATGSQIGIPIPTGPNILFGLAVFGEKTASNPPTSGPVGGMGIPIDTTALLLAGVQGSSFWMIPAIVVAGAGIGIVSFKKSKKKED